MGMVLNPLSCTLSWSDRHRIDFIFFPVSYTSYGDLAGRGKNGAISE
jgi:hypothetical protein